jgi:hypothetical protein
MVGVVALVEAVEEVTEDFLIPAVAVALVEAVTLLLLSV